MPLHPLSADPAPLPGVQVAAQRWSDLAFVHWRADPAAVAPLLPPGTEPDVFDGSTWVGLIAFRLQRASLGPLPPFPLFGDFTEINVRLYARDAEGRRGVVFRSLEAGSLPAVLAAQTLFGLPYRWAQAAQRRTADGWEYASARLPRGPRTRLRIAVQPGEADDPLSTFLTARWGLFERHLGATRWLPNSHERWRLQPARLVSLRDELVAAAGLPGVVDGPPESVLFSPGVTARFGVGAEL